MQLRVGQSLDSKRERLDFKKSPSTPDRVPSYEIEKARADEFVKKYNEQGAKLFTVTQVCANLGALLGGLAGFHKRSFKLVFGGAFTGLVAGFLAGTGYSVYKKNSLMKEYDVKQISKN